MTEFKEGKPCKRCGGTKRYRSSRECLACQPARGKKYRTENAEGLRRYTAEHYSKNKDAILKRHSEYYSSPEGKAKNMFEAARRRARKSGVPFTITKEYLVQKIREYGRVCPALGVPFQAGIGRPIPESMTLDRFDPSLGYVPGNVWLLSFKANTIKSSATRTELGRVYRWMCKVIGEQTEGENQ